MVHSSNFGERSHCHPEKVSGSRYIGTGPLLRGRPDANLGPGWAGPPGTNILDGGCPIYALYECADAKFISIAPLEPQFYAAFMCVRPFPSAPTLEPLLTQAPHQ